MNYRAFVPLELIEELIFYGEFCQKSWVWKRVRHNDHGGAIRFVTALGNLGRKPESGSERAKMKSRVAAFLETKPLRQNYNQNILLKPLRGFLNRKAATRLSLKLSKKPSCRFLHRLPSRAYHHMKILPRRENIIRRPDRSHHFVALSQFLRLRPDCSRIRTLESPRNETMFHWRWALR